MYTVFKFQAYIRKRDHQLNYCFNLLISLAICSNILQLPAMGQYKNNENIGKAIDVYTLTFQTET